ncbi:hypothetical protein GCM10027168_56780 [Streptomyces capparidis]
MPTVSSRARTLGVCSALVAALLAVAVFAPLPFSIVVPGQTADTLGRDKGTPVITIEGTETRTTSGKLLLTTIAATQPDATVHLDDVLSAWLDEDRAAMPRSAVYPEGDSTEEIEEYNERQMRTAQHDATTAALDHLGLSPSQVKVDLNLADVGGPSAGLMFSLGIIDKLHGDGRGGDLTGGRVIAGTGTITEDGEVGPVGGAPLKQLGARRDGATVFLVPEDQCTEVAARTPEGLRLIPVGDLKGAVDALKALKDGGKVPSC